MDGVSTFQFQQGRCTDRGKSDEAEEADRPRPQFTGRMYRAAGTIEAYWIGYCTRRALATWRQSAILIQRAYRKVMRRRAGTMALWILQQAGRGLLTRRRIHRYAQRRRFYSQELESRVTVARSLTSEHRRMIEDFVERLHVSTSEAERRSQIHDLYDEAIETAISCHVTNIEATKRTAIEEEEQAYSQHFFVIFPQLLRLCHDKLVLERKAEAVFQQEWIEFYRRFSDLRHRATFEILESVLETSARYAMMTQQAEHCIELFLQFVPIALRIRSNEMWIARESFLRSCIEQRETSTVEGRAKIENYFPLFSVEVKHWEGYELIWRYYRAEWSNIAEKFNRATGMRKVSPAVEETAAVKSSTAAAEPATPVLVVEEKQSTEQPKEEEEQPDETTSEEAQRRQEKESAVGCDPLQASSKTHASSQSSAPSELAKTMTERGSPRADAKLHARDLTASDRELPDDEDVIEDLICEEEEHRLRTAMSEFAFYYSLCCRGLLARFDVAAEDLLYEEEDESSEGDDEEEEEESESEEEEEEEEEQKDTSEEAHQDTKTSHRSRPPPISPPTQGKDRAPSINPSDMSEPSLISDHSGSEGADEEHLSRLRSEEWLKEQSRLQQEQQKAQPPEKNAAQNSSAKNSRDQEKRDDVTTGRWIEGVPKQLSFVVDEKERSPPRSDSGERRASSTERSPDPPRGAQSVNAMSSPDFATSVRSRDGSLNRSGTSPKSLEQSQIIQTQDAFAKEQAALCRERRKQSTAALSRSIAMQRAAAALKAAKQQAAERLYGRGGREDSEAQKAARGRLELIETRERQKLSQEREKDLKWTIDQLAGPIKQHCETVLKRIAAQQRMAKERSILLNSALSQLDEIAKEEHYAFQTILKRSGN